MKSVRFHLLAAIVLSAFGVAPMVSAQVAREPDDDCGSANPYYYKLDAHRASLLRALRTPTSDDPRAGNGCVVPTRWTNEEFGQLAEGCDPLKVGPIDDDAVCYTEPRYFRMDREENFGATTTQPRMNAPATTQPSGGRIIIIPKRGWPEAPAGSDKMLVLAD